MAGESQASPSVVQKQVSVETYKLSNRKEDYELFDVIGSGATSVVQAARCLSNGQKVAIKRIDLEQCGATIEELQREIGLMNNCHHPNVVNYYTSFIVKDELWLIMKMMSGGSLLDIIKHITASGCKGGVLDEIVIATVLKGVLQGLEYFHGNGLIHRDVKAGNILIGEDGAVQVADFGVSNWLYDSQIRLGGKASSRKNPRTTFVGTPCWMAPEVMDQSVGYNEKADVWSFGITALELATGTAPYAKFPPMKVLMLTLENPPPTLETCGDLNSDDYRKHYSKTFQKMVEKCLQRDPTKRPTATELLKHPFFKKAKENDFLVQTIIEKGPSFASRAKRVKRVPGSSGRLHKTGDGGWVWSDDEMSETIDEQSGENIKQPVDAAISSTSDPVAVTTQSSSTATPADIPTLQVSGSSATSADEAALTQLKITQMEEQMKLLKIEREQLTTQQQQNPAEFFEEQYQQSAKLLEEIQRLEREKHELEFQASRQRGSTPKLPTLVAPPPQNVPMKLCLRKRTEQNQLKDIKFDFIPGKDSADAISNDLITAGLLEMKDMVVVAANILKLVESPSQKKLMFPLGNLPSSQLDEKKLIGYAQLNIIE